MKASEKKWNEVETYKSVTFAMITGYLGDGGCWENFVRRNGYAYYTVNSSETGFSGRIRMFRGECRSYYEVKVGKKWIDFSDFDWDC